RDRPEGRKRVRAVRVLLREIDEARDVRQRIGVAAVVVAVAVPPPVVGGAVVGGRDPEVDPRAEGLVEVEPDALTARAGLPLDPLLAADRPRGVVAGRLGA